MSTTPQRLRTGLRRHVLCILFVCAAAWLPSHAAPSWSGEGADCAGLLSPEQRWAWVRHPRNPLRAVLLIDDGRLMPLRVDREAVSLSGSWPLADCRIEAVPPPTLTLALPDAAAAALVDAVTDAPSAEEAAARPGGLAQREAHWRQAEERLRPLLDDQPQTPVSAALLQRLQALVSEAAIAAGGDNDAQPLQRRWQALRERLGPDSAATLEALIELAAACIELERPGDSFAALDPDMAVLRQAKTLPRRQTLRAELLHVRALSNLHGAARALPAASALVAAAQAALPPGDLTRWDCEFMLARVLIGAGRREQAAALLERLATGLTEPASRRAGLLHDRLAVAYLSIGRLSEGLLATQRSYLLTIELVGADHPDGLRAINNYANNLRQIGDLEAAEPFARQAFEGYRRRYGDGHSVALISGRSLSLVLGELHQPMQALAVIEPQLAAAQRRLPADDPQLLNTRIHHVELLDLVDRHADAVAVGEALLAPVERRFGSEGELTIVAYTLVAGAAAGAGDRERARRLLDDAVERIARIDDQRRALALLDVAARAAERVGDPVRHEALLARFVDLAERADRSGLSEDTASWVQQFRAAPHLRWVVMRAERGETEAAFDLSERFKGRVLLATLGRVAGDASPVLPEKVRRELADARLRIRTAEAEAAAATELGARIAAGARREAASQDYLALRKRVQRENPRFAAVSDAPVLTAGDVPRLLTPGACLLSFVMAEAHAGVFVLAPGQPIRWLTLPPPKSIDAWVQRARDAWSTPAGANGEAAFEELARVLEPAVKACPRRTRRLILSPDGALALLPFEPLAIGGRRLVERYDISYVQSFSVFGVLQRRQPPPVGQRALLGVGAPSFAADAEAGSVHRNLPAAAVRSAAQNAAVATLAQDPQAARRAFDAMGMRWSPLPGAERELRQVARLFPAAALLTGDEASEERLAKLNTSGALSRFRYLLFATHGFLSYTHPSLSSIVLRQPGTLQHDGYLTAAELPLYRLDSELAVLSACETGVGPVRAGSGVMGLPLALMAAGNRHTVVSLWSVPDRSTAELIPRMFRHLRQGATPAVALSRAKRELARQASYVDPLHWAGFVLYGAQ